MYVGHVELRLLTWNLQHGRSVPPAGHDLFDEFAAALAGWPWDVALLQEAPPWWPDQLGRRLEAESRLVLTSRNSALALRRAIAVRWPDLIKSNGGGCNAVLVRGATIAEHRTLRLRRRPERRQLQAVRLSSGVWVGNLHATVRDAQAAEDEAHLAGRTLRVWAGEAPAALGGDFNIRSFAIPEFTRAGGHDVDHVFVRGLEAEDGAGETRERGRLSDHAPVLVRMRTS